jgi:hypothetical protein
MKSKHLDNAIDQGGEALGVVVDLLAPGLREKLTGKRGDPETIRPRASDVVVEASEPDACPMCEGPGELQNFRGRFVTCITCGGKGKKP